MSSMNWNRRALLAGAAMTVLAACTPKAGEQKSTAASGGKTFTVERSSPVVIDVTVGRVW